MASYETKDTKNKQFKVRAEEKLDVLIKDKGGEQTQLSVDVAAAQNTPSLTPDRLFRVVARRKRRQADGLVSCTLPGEGRERGGQR